MAARQTCDEVVTVNITKAANVKYDNDNQNKKNHSDNSNGQDMNHNHDVPMSHNGSNSKDDDDDDDNNNNSSNNNNGNGNRIVFKTKRKVSAIVSNEVLNESKEIMEGKSINHFDHNSNDCNQITKKKKNVRR